MSKRTTFQEPCASFFKASLALVHGEASAPSISNSAAIVSAISESSSTNQDAHAVKGERSYILIRSIRVGLILHTAPLRYRE